MNINLFLIALVTGWFSFIQIYFPPDKKEVSNLNQTTLWTAAQMEAEMCQENLGPNLYPNGDFGSGASPFGAELPTGRTTYNFQDQTWPNDGFYAILNNWDTDVCEGFFPFPCWQLPIKDNSNNPQGYAMVINATEGATEIFYQHNLSGFCEGATYQLSVDIKNLNNPAFFPFSPASSDTVILPNIDIVIGSFDATLQDLQAAPATFNTGDIINDGQWKTYGFNFTINPGNNGISFALRNNAPGGGGNDFLLDNISIRRCATARINAKKIACPDEMITLEAIFDDDFNTPVILWQVSSDGVIWNNISGQGGRFIEATIRTNGIRYRYKIANSQAELNDPFCSMTSEEAVIQLFSDFSNNISATICEGETYAFGNNVLSEAGMFTEIFTSSGGCDSIVNLELSIQPLARSEFQISLCEGLPYKGKFYFNDTALVETYLRQTGCDSIVTTFLNFVPQENREIDRRVCKGERVNGIVINRDTSLVISERTTLGCERFTTVDIKVVAEDAFEIDGSKFLCEDMPTELSVNTIFLNYKWSTGATTPAIQVDQAGTYSVTVTTDNFCEVSNEFTVLPADEFVPLIDVVMPSCLNESGGSITVLQVENGLPPYRYALNGGIFSENPQFSGLAAGDYIIEVMDGVECIRDYQYELVSATEPFELSAPTALNIVKGQSTPLMVNATNPIISYVWGPAAGLDCTDCASPNAGPVETTVYSLMAIDSSGCMDSLQITVVVQEATVNVASAFSPNNDGVNDNLELFFQGPVSKLNHFQVFDRWGELVFSTMETNAAPGSIKWDGTFKGQKLDSGVFIWFAEFEISGGATEFASGEVLLLK